jgi:DNA-directed RNA polymerase specialized sigma24 family protein
MSRSAKTERDAAFTAFVETASPALLSTAWLLTGDHHAAHELVQAALVRTHVAWPRVRSESALTYARRVLVNERTDRWRPQRGEVAVAEPPETRTPM